MHYFEPEQVHSLIMIINRAIIHKLRHGKGKYYIQHGTS